MVWLIGLVVGLPLSVWLLAALCAVIDEPQPVAAMVRLSLGICGVLLLLLLTDASFFYPLVTSFVIVVVLHTGGFFLIRELGTGVPVYERTPPHPPLLNDAVNNGTGQASETD